VNRSELIEHIKNEVAQAALDKNKDAVNMYLVVKYADQLREIDPIDFALSIGRNESYATEFRKGLKLATIINERGL
jgi:hypothetical protein